MKIATGNDHIAIELKEIVKEFMESKGYEVIDLGTNSTENCDYPIYREKVGEAVASGEADLGIAICDAGVRIPLAADKVEGICTCACSEPYTAKLPRMHNSFNALALGTRMVKNKLAKMITGAWLDARFEGGRHERRVNVTMEVENRQDHKNRAGI